MVSTWNTSGRPTGKKGMIGVNTQLTCLEAYDGDNWLTTSRKETVKRITPSDSPYSVATSDDVIIADITSGAITVNLPVGVEARHLNIIKVGTGAANLTACPYGSEELYGGGAGACDISGKFDIYFNGVNGWW